MRIGVSAAALKLIAAGACVLVGVGFLSLGFGGWGLAPSTSSHGSTGEGERLRLHRALLAGVEKDMEALKASQRQIRAALSGPLPGGWEEAVQAIGGDSMFNALVESRMAAEAESTMVWPHDGPLSRGFESGRHAGIDIAGNRGEPVRAAKAGRVSFAGRDSLLGNLVILDHGAGLTTLYAHNDRLEVRTGDMVSRGQMISRLGSSGESTGPHVHFEVKIGVASRPPLHYLGARP